VNRTAALTQKCTNKAGEDHWWDLNGLIYERISVMFLGAKFGNLGTKKREGGGGALACPKYNGFWGGKMARNPPIKRKNFLKASF